MTGIEFQGPVTREAAARADESIYRCTSDGRTLVIKGAEGRPPPAGSDLSLRVAAGAADHERHLLVIRVGAEVAELRALDFWVHEPLPSFYANLDARFGPNRRGRLLVRLLVSLLGLPGMRGALTRWHARRTA